MPEQSQCSSEATGRGDRDEVGDLHERETAPTATAANSESDSRARSFDSSSLQEDAKTQTISPTVTVGAEAVVENGSFDSSSILEDANAQTISTTPRGIEIIEDSLNDINSAHLYVDEGKKETNKDGLVQISSDPSLPPSYIVDDAVEEQKKRPAKNGVDLVQISSPPPLPSSYITDQAIKTKSKIDTAIASNQILSSSISHPSDDINIEHISPTVHGNTQFSVRQLGYLNRVSSGGAPTRAASLPQNVGFQDTTVRNQGRTSRIHRISPLLHRMSGFRRLSQFLVHATLVEESDEENDPIEVFYAEPVGCCQKHWKALASFSFFVLAGFVTFMVLFLNGPKNPSQPTPVPSSAPSMAPSLDPRPTLEIVQERGILLCGMDASLDEDSFRHQLCQAVAAVVLNNPNALEKVNVSSDKRFAMLENRVVDLLASGDTHTIEREVYEPTTGSSFTFSMPYYYDRMVFAGNVTYVKCAEQQIRYAKCSDLFICVSASTTNSGYIKSHFSPNFFRETSGIDESMQLYHNGPCNVIATSHFSLLNLKINQGDSLGSSFVIGNETFNNDPLAFVTRPDNSEWSKIVNWALQALFFAERQGITKNESMCQHNADNFSGHWSELNFLNAVYCVGNYGEIYNSSQLSEYDRILENTINNGTAMLYVIPYGNLDNVNPKFFNELSETFAMVKNRTILNCGLFVHDGFVPEDSVAGAEGLAGMGVSFCRTLASSMLQGNINAANFTSFQSAESSLLALNSRHIDVLFGVPADMSRNFGNKNFSGVTFSTSYYYGNETGKSDVSYYPVMTRQDDLCFSSFVNCIVLSTFYALSVGGISKNESSSMPTMTIFGEDMLWSLKDAISAHGNYDEIYQSNFDDYKKRGRNDLNYKEQPQFLDMPGLPHV